MEQAVARLNINNRNLDPDNSMYDRESDDDFEIDSSEDEDEDPSKDTVQSEYVVRSRRENYHQQQRNNRDAQ